MRQYIITSGPADRADMIRKLTDGKHAFGVFFTPGVCRYFTADGRPNGAEETTPDRDAVRIPADADEKAIKAARARAAGRETVRAIEDAAAAILEKGPAATTAADRLALLRFVNVAYHSSGKIEGCHSIDSTAGCEFCEKTRAAAAENVLIICGMCYAAADAYKEFSWRRHTLNARILSTVLFTPEEFRAAFDIPEGALVRINEDGDTVNETHARNILRIMAAFPGARFGYWFKNVPAVAAGLQAEGIRTRADRPKNARFVQSSLLIGFRAAPVWFADCTFTVYPDAETTAAAIAEGAWACNGRRCRACGYWCYTPENNGGIIPDVAEVLRCGKDARAAIMAAYTEKKARG